MTQPPARDDQTPNTRIQKPRRPEAWALLLGLVILLGLFGFLLKQQQAAKRAANSPVEASRRESPSDAAATESKGQAAQQTPTPRANATKPTAPTPREAVYRVTHKHRLRDCHGTLTFTRDGLRFDSDEPQDSFTVGRDDVTIEGADMRIHDKTWRFEFDDPAVRAERMFRDWKMGILGPASPSR